MRTWQVSSIICLNIDLYLFNLLINCYFELLKGKILSQEQELIQLRNSVDEQERYLKELYYSNFEEKLKVQQEVLKVFILKIL
jgi:hypothetical protein